MKPKRYVPLQRVLRARCRSAHNDFLVALADDFIGGAIKQHRRVYLASPPNGSLVQSSGRFAGRETIYARELRQLQEAGYRRNGDYLEPPG